MASCDLPAKPSVRLVSSSAFGSAGRTAKAPSLQGRVLIMKDLTSSELPRLMTTAEIASVLRVDRSTLSRWRSSGSRSARDVVIFLVTAVSARRRRRVVAPDSRMTIRKQPSGRFYAVLKTGRSYVAGRTLTPSVQRRPGWPASGRRSREVSIRGRVEPQYELCCRFGSTSGSIRCLPRPTRPTPRSPAWSRPP